MPRRIEGSPITKAGGERMVPGKREANAIHLKGLSTLLRQTKERLERNQQKAISQESEKDRQERKDWAVHDEYLRNSYAFDLLYGAFLELHKLQTGYVPKGNDLNFDFMPGLSRKNPSYAYLRWNTRYGRAEEDNMPPEGYMIERKEYWQEVNVVVEVDATNKMIGLVFNYHWPEVDPIDPRKVSKGHAFKSQGNKIKLPLKDISPENIEKSLSKALAHPLDRTYIRTLYQVQF